MTVTRRTFLGGAAAAVASAPVVSVGVHHDPLLSAIHDYQASLAEFSRLAHGDNDWDELAEVTYVPYLDALSEWSEPATTLEGAKEALRISLDEKDGVYGRDAAERMVRAALAYLETLAA